MGYRCKKALLLLTLLLVLTVGSLTACKTPGTENAVVTLAEQHTSLAVGQSKRLDVSVYPTDGQSCKVDWISSDPAIVQVDKGVITGLRAGEAVVTVRIDGRSDACRVTVLPIGRATATEGEK